MRVLFVQARFNPPGGGNGVPAWMIEALHGDHDVTLLAVETPDFDAINAYYGTSIDPRRLRLLPIVWWPIGPHHFRFARNARLQQHARRLAGGYDLLVWPDGEADLGDRSVCYVHYPYPNPRRDWLARPWFERLVSPVAWYGALVAWAFDYQYARLARVRTFTNSAWTKRLIATVTGLDAEVLFPPAAGRSPHQCRPFAERRPAVLCVGRIAAEKRQDEAIAVVERARALGADLTLTIVGSSSNPNGGWEAHIHRLAAARPWVTLRTDVTRTELEALMDSHRFAIHMMRDEHFGMAPAELLRAGCVTWVHRSGGVQEIVDFDEGLMFDDVNDLAGRLYAAATDDTVGEALATRVHGLGARFDTARFASAFRSLLGC